MKSQLLAATLIATIFVAGRSSAPDPAPSLQAPVLEAAAQRALDVAGRLPAAHDPTSGAAAVHSAFTGQAATEEMAVLDRVVESETDAGVGTATFTRVDGTSDPALIEGTVDTWSAARFGGVQTVSISHNLIDFRMTLTRDTTGAWRAMTFSWQFVPGHGP